MIKTKKATGTDTEVLALLGRITYAESHGSFIEDKNDLSSYINDAFSILRTKQEINDHRNLFYIVYADDLPIGYAKLVLNAVHESVASKNNCRLERIYILETFIPMRIGQQLLDFVEEEAKVLELDTIWLSVYIKNYRAIRFYKRNGFKEIGELSFKVNERKYENIVFSKKI